MLSCVLTVYNVPAIYLLEKKTFYTCFMKPFNWLETKMYLLSIGELVYRSPENKIYPALFKYYRKPVKVFSQTICRLYTLMSAVYPTVSIYSTLLSINGRVLLCNAAAKHEIPQTDRGLRVYIL